MLNETDRLRILDYVCGRLAEDERIRLEAELGNNDELRRELQHDQKADDWLAALPDERVRTDPEIERFVRRVLQAAHADAAGGTDADARVPVPARTPARTLHTPRVRRPLRSRTVWLAAAALVIGAGLYGG